MALLETHKLTKTFGGLVAVKELGLAVESGEILGIIGPNGSGKTTLFNLISGIYTPTSGQILFNQRIMNRNPPHQYAEAGIARTFQTIRLFSEMSVLENVMIGRHCRTEAGCSDAIRRSCRHVTEEKESYARAEELLVFFGPDCLPPHRYDLARELSYANQRRLEITRALATDPKLLLLDEPAAGMNPNESSQLMNDIFRIRDLGITIVVIEHDMSVIAGLCDRVIALDHGELIAEGDYEFVRTHPQVIESYLGSNVAH